MLATIQYNHLQFHANARWFVWMTATNNVQCAMYDADVCVCVCVWCSLNQRTFVYVLRQFTCFFFSYVHLVAVILVLNLKWTREERDRETILHQSPFKRCARRRPCLTNTSMNIQLDNKICINNKQNAGNSIHLLMLCIVIYKLFRCLWIIHAKQKLYFYIICSAILHAFIWESCACVCVPAINQFIVIKWLHNWFGWLAHTDGWMASIVDWAPYAHTLCAWHIRPHVCTTLRLLSCAHQFCCCCSHIRFDRRVATANPKFIQFFVFCFCIHLFMFNSYCCCKWSKKKRLWTSGRWPGQTNIYNRHTKMEKKKNIEFQLITRR